MEKLVKKKVGIYSMSRHRSRPPSKRCTRRGYQQQEPKGQHHYCDVVPSIS